MPDVRRATIYFEPKVHRALRMRAAADDRTVSDMVNAAMKRALAEDAVDLAAVKSRRRDRGVTLADALKVLRRRGKV